MSEWAEIRSLRDRLYLAEQLIALANRALEEAVSEHITPASWRALTDDQRLELMALCCHGCGALEPPRCCCQRDER